MIGESENKMYALAKTRVAELLSRSLENALTHTLTDAQQKALDLRRKQGRIRSKRWRVKNPERVREVQQAYDKRRYANETPEHREKRLAYQKQYRLNRKKRKLENGGTN